MPDGHCGRPDVYRSAFLQLVTCAPVAPTINALKPGTVKELQRGNVEITNVRIMSPGNDFSFGPAPFPGTGDEDKFLSQGLFLP